MVPTQLLWAVIAAGCALGFIARAVLRIHWLLAALAASTFILLGFTLQAAFVHGVERVWNGMLGFFVMFALLALPPALAGAGVSALIFRRRI